MPQILNLPPGWSATIKSFGHYLRDMGDLPEMSTRTFIGIMVAITGNVLISLALNLQKLAHKRNEKKLALQNNGKQNGIESCLSDHLFEEHEEGSASAESSQQATRDDVFSDHPQLTAESATAVLAETRPLIAFPELQGKGYGSATPQPARVAPSPPGRPLKSKRVFTSKLLPFKIRSKQGGGTASTLPVDIMTEEAALHGMLNKKRQQLTENGETESELKEGDYLKSKLWWLGFLLMNVGESGNFISYAFAPASVVAPLGTFALIANCFFSPLILREKFRTRDLLGVTIAVIGAVTVVLSTNASDTRLDPDALLRAILQPAFIVYCLVYITGAMILATLSQSTIGRQWVVVDVGLCALFGGFTVLSTKALSTLLTLQWIQIFTQWITYPLLAVLFLTGVGQIRHLNRALMRFDSKTVIPTQFVLFTLSAIIGSAILYGDFQKANFHQIITFLYGCAATFAGVFIIAWAPNSSGEDIQTDDFQAETDSPIADAAIPGSPEQTRLGLGTIGRRRRATLILPSGVRETPNVRHKRSTISMGISPAHHLLLVHTPPREIPLSMIRGSDNLDDQDLEQGNAPPDSYRRRRTMSWYGNDREGGSRT